MHPTTVTPGRALDARLLVTVVGVLMGLLGMHALTAPSSHDTARAAAPADPAPAAAHDGTANSSHAMSDGRATSTAEANAGAPKSGVAAEHTGGHGSHWPGSVLMMCLAVIAVALSLLWPLARALAAGFLRLPRLTGARLPTRHLELGTGPPPAWQFSVIRC